MGYGIIRVQKVKSAAVGSMQYHNDRMPGEHENPDIDPSRTRENVEYIGHGSYRAEVQKRIDSYRESTRKVRKDAVVLVEGIVTASPEFFEGKSKEECLAFFDDAFDFVRDEFGEENLIHYTVHFDETTAHAHFGATPIKDGQLSWKKFFDGRAALTGFQDRFHNEVSKRHGLERGERGTGVTHREVKELKRDTQRELKAAEENLGRTEEQLGRARDALGDAMGRVADATRAGDEAQERLECLQRRCDRAEGEVERLEEECRRAARAAEVRGRENVRELAFCQRENAGAHRGAEEVLGECRAAVARSLKGEGVPLGAASGAREVAARADCQQLADGMPALQSRLERLRGLVDRAVEGLRSGWGLLSERARAVRAEVARRTGDFPSTARIRDALMGREVGVDLDSEARAMREAASTQRPRGVSQARGAGAR